MKRKKHYSLPNKWFVEWWKISIYIHAYLPFWPLNNLVWRRIGFGGGWGARVRRLKCVYCNAADTHTRSHGRERLRCPCTPFTWSSAFFFYFLWLLPRTSHSNVNQKVLRTFQSNNNNNNNSTQRKQRPRPRPSLPHTSHARTIFAHEKPTHVWVEGGPCMALTLLLLFTQPLCALLMYFSKWF